MGGLPWCMLSSSRCVSCASMRAARPLRESSGCRSPACMVILRASIGLELEAGGQLEIAAGIQVRGEMVAVALVGQVIDAEIEAGAAQRAVRRLPTQEQVEQGIAAGLADPGRHA